MYADSKVLVTGSTGLIGNHLVDLLVKNNVRVRAISHKRKHIFDQNRIEVVCGDLTNYDFCESICKDIDYVFHLAVETGSIVKNAKHPAEIMTSTVLMDFNMLKAAHANKIKKYLYCSCACVYPNDLDDMKEELAWDGPPPSMHETISWSKRIAELQCKSFHKEYGDKISIVRPSNTYGSHDIFELENSHVISAFIKKAVDGINPFTIWGNGEQIREFVHARDVAIGMMKALELSYNAEPINLGGGTAIKIKDLAKMIINISNTKVDVQYDMSKPSGHMKRVLNSEKCKEKLNFIPKITLEDGLKDTIYWYKNNAR